MVGIIVKVRDALQTTFLKSAEEANQQTAAIKRRRKFTPATLAQTFILALLNNPKASHDDIASVAAASGVNVSPQAIEQRYSPSLTAFFRALFEKMVKQVVASEEVLAPKQVPMSVLFCDLRGFAETSEAMSDELFHLLKRVSQTLDVVTGKILSHSGVIGDFHGDSVMGFWGWPLRQDDTAIRAVQTALDIQSEFRKIGEQEDRRDQAGHFKIGIGIATGIAVAGKIGTRDQVKVTAFGPVVNLASRLEGMNRLLNSAVLMDRATRDRIVEVPNTRNLRVRGLGRIQPFGMRAATEVFQILDESESLTAEELAQFQDALTFFQSGQWHQAEELLAGIPDDDAGKQFLQQYLQRTDSRVPEDWNGAIEMTSK